MANPTPFYGWVLPMPTQTPWFVTVNSLLGGIDTAIASVVAGPAMRVTHALSAWIVAPTSVMMTGNAYRAFSCAPFGANSGTLTIVGSAARVTMRLHGQMRHRGGAQNVALGFGLRVVLGKVDGSSPQSYVPMGNSAWLHYCPGQFVEQIHMTWTGSLGPGTYRVQAQVNPAISTYGGAIGDHLSLWVEEMS